MAVSLAHEIAHTLYLGEVYDNFYGDDYDHKNNNNSKYCIMNPLSHKDDYPNNPNKVVTEDIYLNRYTEDILCAYCTEKLQDECPENVYEISEEESS